MERLGPGRQFSQCLWKKTGEWHMLEGTIVSHVWLPPSQGRTASQLGQCQSAWGSLCARPHRRVFHRPLWTSEGLWLQCPSVLFLIEKAFSKPGCIVTYCVCVHGEHRPICSHRAREQASMCYFLEWDGMIVPANPQTHRSLGKQTFASLFYKTCVELT